MDNKKNNSQRETPLSRTEILVGSENIVKLQESKVAVFGVGGVGGYAVEALARSGVGRIDLFDHDKVCLSNINRQLHALHSTLEQYKVDVARERILDINPNAVVNAYKIFYLPENAGEIDLSQYDYIIDAIDTVTGKIELAVQADKLGIPIISSMGAGNKMNITDFQVTDIYKTSVCPLAKVMRSELRRRGIKKLKVVYSKETVKVHSRPPGSNAFVPAAVGLILAGEVVKDIINKK